MPHSYTSGLNSESDEVKSLSEERDTAFDNLGSVIESRLKESEQARLYDEKRWLRSYRNYRGIYGSDMAFRDSEKSKVFVKVTKTKVLAAYGQLIEVLFSQGKFPIGIFPTTDPTGVAKYAHLKPENMKQDQRMDDIYGYEGDGREITPGSTVNDILNGLSDKYGKAGFEEGPAPDLKTMPQIEPAEEAARNMEKLIHDQLEETHAISVMRHVLFEMCLLGTGILKGPFNYEQASHQWSLDDNGERQYSPKTKLVPRVEAVSCWDLYPDPDAVTIDDADYIIQRHVYNRSQLRDLINRPFFRKSAIKEVLAGDIAAAIGLKDVTTGDTLCDADNIVILERMEFPEPVISVAVEPKSKADQEKMGIALGKLAQEDPSFRVKTDEETGQTIISGMGELHLDIIVDRMRREFSVEANIGKPQVAYRERITTTTEIEGKFVRQSGGRGQYGHVWVKFEPAEDTSAEGLEFVNEIVGGIVPREYIPAVNKGIEEQMQNGVLAGYPLLGLKATLYDGSFHDVDSSEMAFKIAASMATKKLAEVGGAELLEPMMQVEVVTPEENMGDVVGDLNRRRGLIQGMDENAAGKIVNAEVPLAEMFGYATDLRSATQGRATYTMEFSKYAPAPSNVAQDIISKNQTS